MNAYIKTALIAVLALAVVIRVPVIRDLVFPKA